MFVWIIKWYWLTRITGWCHLKIWNNLNFWLPLHADRKIGFCFRKSAVTLCVGWYVCCGMLIGVHQSDSNPVLQQRGSIINLHPSKILMTSAQVTAANVREHVARCVSQLPDSKLWPAENFNFCTLTYVISLVKYFATFNLTFFCSSLTLLLFYRALSIIEYKN